MASISSVSLERYVDIAAAADLLPLQGQVSRVTGLVIESSGPRARLGDICEVLSNDASPLPVQVVGFRGPTLLTVPLGEPTGIRPGDLVVARPGAVSVGVGPELLGRVVDALGRPLDDEPLQTSDRVPLFPPPLNRPAPQNRT